MARAIEAYRDNRGNLHHTVSHAVVADIAAALGRVGDEGGLTNGVAILIIEKRREIEQAFADLDALQACGSQASAASVIEHPARHIQSV